MSTERYEFRKGERIVSQKLIDELFGGNQSHSVAVYPLRAVYMIHESQEAQASSTTHEHQKGQAPVQVLISVPKKRFHHAVDRNRVKRQIREAYRHHKDILFSDPSPLTPHLAIAFIWLSDRHFSSSDIDLRVSKLLSLIHKNIVNAAPINP